VPPARLDLGEGLLRQDWASNDALAMRLDPVKCVRGLRNVGLGENWGRSPACRARLLVVRRRKGKSRKAERGTASLIKGDDAAS